MIKHQNKTGTGADLSPAGIAKNAPLGADVASALSVTPAPVQKLSGAEKKLIVCYCLFYGAFAFGSYLTGKWTLDSNGGKLAELLYQFLMQIIPCLIGYYLAIRLCNKISITVLFAGSFLLCAAAFSAFYFLALSGSTQTANLVYGALFGTANGAFWGCCNNLHVSFINRNRRGRFYGINGVWMQTAALAAPLIMLACVAAFGGNELVPQGVFTAFYIMLLVCCAAAVMFAVSIRVEKYKSPFKISAALKLGRDPAVKKFMRLNFLYGAASSIPDAIAGIFIVATAALANYFYLLILVISIAAGGAANFLFSRHYFAKRRVSVFYVSLLATSAIYLAITLLYKSAAAETAGITMLVLSGVFLNFRRQSESVMCNVGISAFNLTDSDLSAVFFLREMYIVLGRLASALTMLPVIFLGEQESLVITVLLSFALVSVLTLLYTRRHFEPLLKGQ